MGDRYSNPISGISANIAHSWLLVQRRRCAPAAAVHSTDVRGRSVALTQIRLTDSRHRAPQRTRWIRANSSLLNVARLMSSGSDSYGILPSHVAAGPATRPP